MNRAIFLLFISFELPGNKHLEHLVIKTRSIWSIIIIESIMNSPRISRHGNFYPKSYKKIASVFITCRNHLQNTRIFWFSCNGNGNIIKWNRKYNFWRKLYTNCWRIASLIASIADNMYVFGFFICIKIRAQKSSWILNECIPYAWHRNAT